MASKKAMAAAVDISTEFILRNAGLNVTAAELRMTAGKRMKKGLSMTAGERMKASKIPVALRT